jgi:uncharacterized protein with GYD domain
MSPMKHITFVRLTDEGRKHLPDAKEVLRKVYDLADSFGGKIEGIWATTGRYDFVTVTDYPTPEAGLKAHTKFLEMGFFVVESAEAFDIDAFLATI